ncbi:MAG: DUF1801 domain-containing protein [Dokdonella sp.]
MKGADSNSKEAASQQINDKITARGDWRGETLARMRKLIHDADPDVIEEVKWRGTPVFSHDGIICPCETYKDKVKLTFAKGASLDDPEQLVNASLEGNARRAIDIAESESVNATHFKTLIRSAAALNQASRKAKSKSKK